MSEQKAVPEIPEDLRQDYVNTVESLPLADENSRRVLGRIREYIERIATLTVERDSAKRELAEIEANATAERKKYEALREERDALAATVERLSAPVSEGATLIAAERQRQVAAEGWTEDHDDGHRDGAMVHAARCYAQAALVSERHPGEALSWPYGWPWEPQWWKPSPDATRNLVKAGALIAAEIDRLQRVAARANPPAKEQP